MNHQTIQLRRNFDYLNFIRKNQSHHNNIIPKHKAIKQPTNISVPNFEAVQSKREQRDKISQYIVFKFPQLITRKVKLESMRKKLQPSSQLTLSYKLSKIQPQPNLMIKTFYQQQPIHQSPSHLQNKLKQFLQSDIVLKSPTDQPNRYSPSIIPLKKVKSIRRVIHVQRDNQLSIYQQKIVAYRQFLFVLNLAHRKFDPLTIKDEFRTYKVENKYKYYLGPGNNALLVKSLLKRRFWWVNEADPKQANLVWTQLKVPSCYIHLPKSKTISYNLPQNQSNLKKSVSPNKSNKVTKQGVYKAPLPETFQKVLIGKDLKVYYKFMKEADLSKMDRFENRLKYFPANLLEPTPVDKKQSRILNHFQCNYWIGNKKYYSLRGKNVFTVIPLTFHIRKGVSDFQYQRFLKEFKKIKDEKGKDQIRNLWIIKPGQLSNRGNGISVFSSINQLNSILKRKQIHPNGQLKTYIVQKYIESPMLYHGRKFDIRHYMMASKLHGRMRAYWFSQGYIRTSSSEYDLDELNDPIMHLTNDAIQKDSDQYGKYEEGNKVSYRQFQKYLDNTYPQKKYSFQDSIYPAMKQIALDAFKSTFIKMDPNNYQHTFEIFGLDFMIDSNFKVWLIQVNTNPCLQLSSNLLSRIIPTMVEHSLRLTLDVIYPPPVHYPNTLKYLAPDDPIGRLQFELIFDEGRDGLQLLQLYKDADELDIDLDNEDEQTFDNEGIELDLNETVI